MPEEESIKNAMPKMSWYSSVQQMLYTRTGLQQVLHEAQYVVATLPTGLPKKAR